MNGWHSVADGMPEYQDVLLYLPERVSPIVRGKRMTREDGFMWEIEGTSLHEKIWDRVFKTPQPTYWRFMPELPE